MNSCSFLLFLFKMIWKEEQKEQNRALELQVSKSFYGGYFVLSFKQIKCLKLFRDSNSKGILYCGIQNLISFPVLLFWYFCYNFSVVLIYVARWITLISFHLSYINYYWTKNIGLFLCDWTREIISSFKWFSIKDQDFDYLKIIITSKYYAWLYYLHH